ncbi:MULTISPECIES: cell envelope integrity protein TolA [Bradyrhizobium]|jgi:protein TonB|uniref:Energy transducer TonB n=1 Tax=Bradyrhizobium denitrificans TaxID=2734912 RepID=A0ABS5G1A0_9BRAD|nr:MULTISPECIES: TonB family protein [Bradyrhizobium]RTL99624.1 MAG: energy transducer TonB [Bradyrhizobiaceae bacterium]MBR1135051.1 energy transducer TonB [Bradyrhizobium denitrificans]MCL8484752.1 TonB family protein [Bradyrhizobium denitrificans]MDU1493937.1 TonB family protein [Bradyrhizobium sp.]MDU1544095.1 TonB family protein [Bradyrhizobium sp.]
MSDLDTGHASSSRLWLLATVAAVALHLGGAALALTSFKNDEDAGGLGAAGAEVIDIDMGSPKVDNDEVPVGQDAPLQNAAPEMQEQKAEVEQTDLPKDVPTTTEEADREVTTSDVKKPTEEQKVATVQTQASEAQESSQESARKSLDDKAPESEKTKAPNVGIGKDRDKLTANWGRKISAYFELHKKYPAGRKSAAQLKLSVLLNRLGRVVTVDVKESSGDAEFDQAAIAMVRRSDPVPRPPAGLTDDEFAFTLPVKFNPPK